MSKLHIDVRTRGLGYVVTVVGCPQVEEEAKIRAAVEAAVGRALAGENSYMALGADIHRFWDEGWPKEYFHVEDDDAKFDMKDTEGELTLDPLKTYDLGLMGWLEPHTDDGLESMDFAGAFLAWMEASTPKDPRREHGRYPNTYAYDYLREYGGHTDISPLLSRSDASQLIGVIAKALGVGKVLLCERLADAYLSSGEEIMERVSKRADAYWPIKNQ